MHYCACTSQKVNKPVTYYGFTNEELDSMTVFLTLQGMEKLRMCQESREFVKDYYNGLISVENLVRYACVHNNDLLPADYCFLNAKSHSQEERLFDKMSDRHPSDDEHKKEVPFTAKEQLEMIRFIKALTLDTAKRLGETVE